MQVDSVKWPPSSWHSTMVENQELPIEISKSEMYSNMRLSMANSSSFDYTRIHLWISHPNACPKINNSQLEMMKCEEFEYTLSNIN